MRIRIVVFRELFASSTSQRGLFDNAVPTFKLSKVRAVNTYIIQITTRTQKAAATRCLSGLFNCSFRVRIVSLSVLGNAQTCFTLRMYTS